MQKLFIYILSIFFIFNSNILKAEIAKFNCVINVPQADGQIVKMEQFFELDSETGNYDNVFSNGQIEWTVWSPSEVGSDVEGKFLAMYHTYNRQNKSLRVVYSQYGDIHKKNEPKLEPYYEVKGSCK